MIYLFRAIYSKKGNTNIDRNNKNATYLPTKYFEGSYNSFQVDGAYMLFHAQLSRDVRKLG